MEHENCRRWLESLSDYVDGELGAQLCAEIDQHLENCQNCRVVVDSLRKTIYLYQVTAPPPDLPGAVRQRLYRRLKLEGR